jgi:pimeloyl-ACP methyl ester carboxylesterase
MYPTTQAPTEETSLKAMDYELAHLTEQGWEFPEGELQKLWVPIQWQPPVLPGPVGENELPTLLFSPGAGMPCSQSIMAQADMASQGYTVLCLDHPGQPPYLKIPYGGGGVRGIPIDYDWADLNFLYNVNAGRKDELDTLLKVFPDLVKEFGAPFNTTTYLHYGFSMGGSIGTYLVANYDSVLGGLNYDGAFIDSMFGETEDVKKPFLMLRDSQDRSGDLSWPWFQGNQTGFWEHLMINGSHHLDFSDVTLWFDLLPMNDTAPLTGTIKGSRMRKILAVLTTAWFNKLLGKPEKILEGPLPSKEWSEVIFVKSSETEG